MAVLNTGEWIAEEDYSKYPKENWCDCDYIAAWIKEVGYVPKTSIENLTHMIIAFYNFEIEEKGYFILKDEREHPDNLFQMLPLMWKQAMVSKRLIIYRKKGERL